MTKLAYYLSSPLEDGRPLEPIPAQLYHSLEVAEHWRALFESNRKGGQSPFRVAYHIVTPDSYGWVSELCKGCGGVGMFPGGELCECANVEAPF